MKTAGRFLPSARLLALLGALGLLARSIPATCFATSTCSRMSGW